MGKSNFNSYSNNSTGNVHVERISSILQQSIATPNKIITLNNNIKKSILDFSSNASPFTPSRRHPISRWPWSSHSLVGKQRLVRFLKRGQWIPREPWRHAPVQCLCEDILPRSDRLRFDFSGPFFARPLFFFMLFFFFLFSDFFFFLFTGIFICSGYFCFYFNSALKAKDCNAGLSIKRRRLQSQGFSEADDKLIVRVERVNVRERKIFFNEQGVRLIFMLFRVWKLLMTEDKNVSFSERFIFCRSECLFFFFFFFP